MPLSRTNRRHSLTAFRKSLAFPWLNTIGGLSFSTLSSGPSELIRMWCMLFIRLTIKCASEVAGNRVLRFFTSSRPMKRPRPRTSPINGKSAISSTHLPRRYCPTCWAFSCSRSSRITSITALAIAHETGFPPYYKMHTRHVRVLNKLLDWIKLLPC